MCAGEFIQVAADRRLFLETGNSPAGTVKLRCSDVALTATNTTTNHQEKRGGKQTSTVSTAILTYRAYSDVLALVRYSPLKRTGCSYGEKCQNGLKRISN
jgi:hypothetical protein